MTTFLHSGCMGDILYAIPSIRALGGGHLYICDRPWTRPLHHRFAGIVPLLMEQDCIHGVSLYNPDVDTLDYDFTTYRFGGLKYGDTIIDRQARWLGVDIDLSKPWLDVIPKRVSKIIISRGPRWQGFFFPWKELVRQFGDDIKFVGLKDEYTNFCGEFGYVPWYETQDLLQTAEAIAGADLFIGSQSCPLAIAEGLHKPTIVEVCCWAFDCINLRHGNIHVIDGELMFVFGGKEFHAHSPHRRKIGHAELELIDKANNRYSELLMSQSVTSN